VAAAQTIVLPPPGTIPKTPQSVRELTTSCSDPSYQLACKSYNELVSSQDPELMALFNSHDAYVCFRESEDVFYIMSLGTPEPNEFVKVGRNTFYQSRYDGIVVFERFKNGQEDESKMVTGQWTKFGPNSNPHFETLSKSIPHLAVTDSEIYFYEEYKNLGGGTTKYTVQIRRSTMRASESFEWHNPSTDPKKPPTNGTDTNSGHCIVFN